MTATAASIVGGRLAGHRRREVAERERRDHQRAHDETGPGPQRDRRLVERGGGGRQPAGHAREDDRGPDRRGDDEPGADERERQDEEQVGRRAARAHSARKMLPRPTARTPTVISGRGPTRLSSTPTIGPVTISAMMNGRVATIATSGP